MAEAAVLQALVQNLIDVSKNEISLIRGLDREAQNLIENLDTIQQFLNDAEKQTTILNGAVKSWLKRLENAAFEADNVLDELHYHSLSKTINKKFKVLTCFSPFIHVARKRNMAVSIQKINMKFDSINKDVTQLGLQQTRAVAPTAPYPSIETDSFSSDPIFIGRDEVVSEIVETLITSVTTHDERVFSILPIVGMGGLGKTTLTQRVFRHQDMETQFGSRIWVHVSQVFDPNNLFKKILKELITSSQYNKDETRQEILRKLEEALKDKTYLLVLDDVWNEEPSKWDGFLNSLLGVTTTKGNAIIVTTRSMKVASIVRPFHIHHLKGLSEEDCWKIISAKTFENEDVPLDIESVGRDIAKRCGGLPLAASVVGGVLQCDKLVDKCVSISDNWLPQGEEEGENNITQILKLSFNNLSSPSLKKCFSYCSIFPKGELLWKEDLIEMWMGEGFLGSNDDMESVGDKFYNVLLHSSLLQVSKREEYDEERCVMHDLVHDLASSVLGNADGVSRVRYLIHKEGKSSPITKEVAQHLRTLIFAADQPFDDNIFSDFKSLHVLILKGVSFEELPRSIRKLIHLRNLNITETWITQLPDWIGELYHLQTLRAERVWELPSTIKYLINLRHLHVQRFVKLPAEIGRLTSLQTLWREFMVQDKNGNTMEELGSLNNLKGSLEITHLEKVHDKEEAEKANLSKKSKLSELILEWSDNREEVERINDENVLEGLQPHSNLKELEIRGFDGKSFPEWTLKMTVRNEPQGSWVGLNQLVEIEFNRCTKCEEIPMLGHLPKLKSLCLGGLSNVKSINSLFYGIGKETGVVFPVLETLKLCDMDSLKEWAEVESGSTSEVKVFPHLRSLKISNCNQLMKVPFNQLQSSCLESLEISGCNQLTTDCNLSLLSKLTSLRDLVLEGFESLPVDQLFFNNPFLSLSVSSSLALSNIHYSAKKKRMAGEGGAAVLQVLVQNLIDLSTNEISLIRGLKKEAQKLTLNLDTIQQFLNDAERRSIPTGAVKSWLQRLENAAFEADNVLDELHYHSLSKTIKKKKFKVLTCFSPFFHIGGKRNMAVSIQEINMNLDSINETATELGLQKIFAVAPTVPDAGRETDSFSGDPIFIGRDEVVSEIVETLTNSVATHDDEHVFSILPIVGMGGLGKTTLTRNVFHHQNMKTRFGSRIWVHVSQGFDPIKLFNKILKELMTSSQSNKDASRQEILRKLAEALKDKTYLLVLDDVWNEEPSKWKDFLNSLSGVTNTKGNAIIVTTRSMKVASIEGALDIHELKGLPEEDCWKIIRAKTFGNEDVPLDIESIGKEIAKRCGGLPLAASVVGGVLRCDKSVDKWVSIRDDWLPDGEEEGENYITKILRLSFNNLSSPSLKKCFAYCSIFPKGEYKEKQKLIEMWMGEGFLGSNEDMESVGDKFYNVLLHSSLLQVHDLASSVLGNADGVSRVRYLFHKQGKSSPIKKEVAQHLRTLIFQADQPFDDNIFSDFKSLHVLILKGRSFKELPRSIRKLIHLRNLNIEFTSIGDLPDWIGELHHLQALRAPYGVEKLPSTIKYLINLRHLHVHDEAELPAEIGRLTYLQTLWREFIVRDKNGYKIEELGSLNNLKGSLTIERLEKVHDKEEAEKANLSKKSKLSELRLEWSDNREEVERINDENVLEGLQPPSNMKKLEIWGFNGKSFPEWTLKMTVRNEPQGSWVGLNQLVEIEFNRCTKCEEIPMLGHLPNLKSLSFRGLRNVKSIKSSFYGIGNETGVVFPMLETLILFNMDSLKEWAEVESGSTSEEKVFPHLRSLKISDCNQLMKVPFNHFSSYLRSLEISGCNQLTTDSYLPLLSKLTSLRDLVLEGLESLPVELFDNNPHLSVLKIRQCPKLREIPDGLNFLQELIIEECPDLKRIGCPRKEYHGFSCLTELGIRECHGLMDFPYEILESQALKKVALEGLSSLSNLPRLIECLAKSAARLKELRIVDVPKFLATSVDQVWHFPNLKRFVIDVSMEGSRETSVATLDRILQGCSCDSLCQLYLTGMDSWECLPESIQHLTSLAKLGLRDFGMEELPEWFDQYISDTVSCTNPWVFHLHLYGCKRLKCLPSTEAMQRLIKEEKVDIMGCPELQQQSDDANIFPHPLTCCFERIRRCE